MTIREMGKMDLPAAEAMWRDIFEESPAFASYYFAHRFSPEHAFGAFEDDRLVAMAHGRPTTILIEGRPYKALLIAGVATLPEYQRINRITVRTSDFERTKSMKIVRYHKCK